MGASSESTRTSASSEVSSNASSIRQLGHSPSIPWLRDSGVLQAEHSSATGGLPITLRTPWLHLLDGYLIQEK